MRKRNNISSIDIDRWLKKGLGQGKGKSYQPFFHVRDVPSTGRSSMVLGMKTGRIHHYLSDLEYSCHLLAEFSPKVTDIREQYALLQLKKTQRIATILGIRHPIYPGTKTPVVMTSDLVLTAGKGKNAKHSVICVKHSSALNPKNPKSHRAVEKLLIEKTYWDLKGVSWKLATEQNIPMTRVRNLDLLRTSLIAEEIDDLNSKLFEFVSVFEDTWKIDRSLNNILDKTGMAIKLDRRQCFHLFGRAVWLRLLSVDLDSEVIHHHMPLRLRPKDEQNDRN